MNKIVASLGLAAIGASGLQAVAADDLGAQAAKIWNVSASLRGFYDDNINTAHGGTNKVDSTGLEVSPSLGLAWEGEGTSLSLSYVYSFKYYDTRPAGNTENYDQTHMFNATLEHSFSPRYHVAVNDSFVIGQEPDVLRAPDQPGATPQRISGQNIRNYGSVVFDAQFTPVFSLEANYNNVYFDYDSTFNNALQVPFTPLVASSSGLLDRMENQVGLEGHWQMQPETVGLVGYQFGLVDYTGNEFISGIYPIGVLKSDNRNSQSHYGYLGALHTFNPELKGTFKGGFQYIDFVNTLPGTPNSTEVSPYIQMSLAYTYAPESHVDIGFSQQRSPTDALAAAGANYVKDTDVSLVYGSITHRFAPRLFGSIIGTFQNSIFNGGTIDGDAEQFYELGLNLKYRFNTYLWAEAGYNFDHLQSYASSLSYDRNRVYLGIGANY